VFEKRRIRKNGVIAQALVLSSEYHSKWSSADYQKYDYVLEVRPEGREPFRATLQEKFTIMERKPAEAETVKVKYDPDTLQVVFHLDGDPRYDLEAMQAQATQRRWDAQGGRPS